METQTQVVERHRHIKHSTLHAIYLERVLYQSTHLTISAVTVSIFEFVVGFLIKTEVHGSVLVFIVPAFNHVHSKH